MVGCDRSWESQNAVVAATREASLRGSELVLLAVVETPRFRPDGLAWIARMEAESTLDAQGALAFAIAKVLATDSAVPVRFVLVNDLDSPELAELVRRTGLLVLGRRGDGGQVAFSLGSTSAELAARFHCPILVTHDQGRSTKRPYGREPVVYAGMDTTGPTGAVISVAATEAALRGLPLFVVHVLPPGQAIGAASIDQHWRSCSAALKDHQSAAADVPVRLVITRDDPSRALVVQVAPGDLLVIGTRGQGRLAGLVKGSVSRKILNDATCDVMVVPPASIPQVTDRPLAEAAAALADLLAACSSGPVTAQEQRA